MLIGYFNYSVGPEPGYTQTTKIVIATAMMGGFSVHHPLPFWVGLRKSESLRRQPTSSNAPGLGAQIKKPPEGGFLPSDWLTWKQQQLQRRQQHQQQLLRRQQHQLQRRQQHQPTRQLRQQMKRQQQRHQLPGQPREQVQELLRSCCKPTRQQRQRSQQSGRGICSFTGT